jgi:hypothetical protein
MCTYPFPDVNCTIPEACDVYIRNNINWVSNYQGMSTNPLTIYTTDPLTQDQLSTLTTLLSNYNDPPVWLQYDHTTSYPLHSHFTSDPDNTINNNEITLQTWIFSEQELKNNNLVLDSMKSIVEYNCPNVQNFLNITSGSTLQTGLTINDLSRNITIASQNIDIDDIALVWHNMAVSGTTGGNVQYKSIQYTGLMNKNPNYDTIWQLTTPKPIDPNFTFRVHSLQYIYYTPIYRSA